jgi:hypothetical protein
MHVPMPQHLQKLNHQVLDGHHSPQEQFEQNHGKRLPKGTESTDTCKAKIQTLATGLQVLSQEDAHCIFTVRNTRKLGFEAPSKLKTWFSAYGPVVRILLAHSTVKTFDQPNTQSWRRPSNLGFVQMASPTAVQAILARGSEHVIQGVSISVQQFSIPKSGALDEAAFEDEEEGMQDFSEGVALEPRAL